ncbi:MAG: DNA-3-methyladenine glycosylase [Bacteroidetes bacterium GWC2_33_15]|nr:MAG: DNA-3-methyladenine glycosylase [Bacteroidetes bacterium GWA2_33_15]OFX51590.1 MAG: DNA-3-methyladenine glycosylase [Bacteroidetes bacterium GWC2_33_15]OFX63369.1 MAG: DNA-3-methyladenine glycosylase [Bacteroidetes bacterium GWB2_32_14]OFX68060.1 MAG: DNA-3-methyladenine glycosylase [Bacteroidetes bacterium GWD2_33_33]HAN17143.1 DNA-3-methyladenine glycosylase I [Bacteroidales bacterium]
MTKERCPWPKKPLDTEYHDHEWGVPLHDDRKLFEFLVLDAFQAGLSWSTILNKRENFRKAFDQFDYHKISAYGQDKINELLHNEGIIRNKLKINATIKNANAFIKVQQEFGSFDKYIWSFTGGKTIINKWNELKEIPAKSKESDAMSKDLQKRGFTFVGSTICYAFMQAAGMINDHLVSCYRYKEIKYDN